MAIFETLNAVVPEFFKLKVTVFPLFTVTFPKSHDPSGVTDRFLVGKTVPLPVRLIVLTGLALSALLVIESEANLPPALVGLNRIVSCCVDPAAISKEELNGLIIVNWSEFVPFRTRLEMLRVVVPEF